MGKVVDISNFRNQQSSDDSTPIVDITFSFSEAPNGNTILNIVTSKHPGATSELIDKSFKDLRISLGFILDTIRNNL